MNLDELTRSWNKKTDEEKAIAQMSAFGNFEFVTNIRGERVMVRKPY